MRQILTKAGKQSLEGPTHASNTPHQMKKKVSPGVFTLFETTLASRRCNGVTLNSNYVPTTGWQNKYDGGSAGCDICVQKKRTEIEGGWLHITFHCIYEGTEWL